jgi:Flp pilus assembly protein TadD
LDRQGKFDDAISEYRNALRLEPSNPEIQADLGAALGAKGVSFATNGDVESAITLLREAIHWEPTNVAAHSALGFALVLKGNLGEGIREYDEALTLNGFDTGLNILTHTRLGVALIAAGDIDRAITEFSYVSRQRPRSASAHYGLGLALASKRNTKKADEEFAEAKRLNPNFILPDGLTVHLMFASPDALVRGFPYTDNAISQYHKVRR